MRRRRRKSTRPPLYVLLRFYLAKNNFVASPSDFWRWLIERYGARYATSRMTIYQLFHKLCRLGLLRRVRIEKGEGGRGAVRTLYEAVRERWEDPCWAQPYQCFREREARGELVECEQPGPVQIIHRIVYPEGGGEDELRGDSEGVQEGLEG